MTQQEKMLAVAAKMVEFSKEQFIVGCWKAYPKDFALRDHPEYPDSNKIVAAMSGVKGLVRQGFLLKKGSKYVCTMQGVERAKGDTPVHKNGKVKVKPPIMLNGKQKSYRDTLGRMLQSMAWLHWSSGDKSLITSRDAKEFWGPQPNLVLLDRELANMEEEFGNNPLLVGDEYVSSSEIRQLAHLHRWMKEKFGKRLEITG